MIIWIILFILFSYKLCSYITSIETRLFLKYQPDICFKKLSLYFNQATNVNLRNKQRQHLIQWRASLRKQHSWTEICIKNDIGFPMFQGRCVFSNCCSLLQRSTKMVKYHERNASLPCHLLSISILALLALFYWISQTSSGLVNARRLWSRGTEPSL